jgi:hypothetical protein
LPVWVSVSSSKVSSSVPNPPGRQTNARLSFTSMSLRVKKYFMLTYFSSPAMTGFAPCSNGQPDRHADAALAPGALHARLHDARAGAGDDHPAALGELGGDVVGVLVERVVGAGAGRAEDRDLRDVAVRIEHGEGVAHLGDRERGDLQVER